MKSKVIARPEVQSVLANLVATELYTDRGPDPKGNGRVQVEQFGTATLPLYVVVSPEGKELSRLELETGLATTETFVAFLKKGLDAYAAAGNGAPSK